MKTYLVSLFRYQKIQILTKKSIISKKFVPKTTLQKLAHDKSSQRTHQRNY